MKIKSFYESVGGNVHFALFEMKGSRFGKIPKDILYASVSDDLTSLKNNLINIVNENIDSEYIEYNKALEYWNSSMDTEFYIVNAKSNEKIEESCWLSIILNTNKLNEVTAFTTEEQAQVPLNELMDELAGWQIKGDVKTDEFRQKPFEEKIAIYNDNNRLGYTLFCKESEFLRNVKIDPEILKKNHINRFDL